MKQQSPQEVINKCFYDQSIKVIKLIFENSKKQQLDIEELEEEFKNFWQESNNKEIKVPVEKQKRKPKELSDDEKCIAAKKDGGRCNGKRFMKGKNPLLCSLHNNNGMNFGSYDNPIEVTSSKETKNKEQKELKNCSHTFGKGNRKGENCFNLPLNNTDKCKLHAKKSQKKEFLENEEENEEENEDHELYGYEEEAEEELQF